MEVYNVAIYEPSNGVWNRVSYWDRSQPLGTNLVWMVNKGGSPYPGDWSICHGNSQTYLSADGNNAASSPQPFTGTLGNDDNVNVMSSQRCSDDVNCPGFERQVDYTGWRGNSCGEKMIVFSAQMPNIYQSGVTNNNLPAIWLLNGQVVRTNQWGCNCRGVGADGGCGEIDIVEAIPGRSDQDLTSTLYSFKQSLGANGVFTRPANSISTYAVIFDGSGTGAIHAIELSDFPYSSTQIAQSTVTGWTNSNPSETVTLENPYTGPACAGSIFGTSGQNAVGQTDTSFQSANPDTATPAQPAVLWIGVGAGTGVAVIIVLAVIIVVMRSRSSKKVESV